MTHRTRYFLALSHDLTSSHIFSRRRAFPGRKNKCTHLGAKRQPRERTTPSWKRQSVDGFYRLYLREGMSRTYCLLDWKRYLQINKQQQQQKTRIPVSNGKAFCWLYRESKENVKHILESTNTYIMQPQPPSCRPDDWFLIVGTSIKQWRRIKFDFSLPSWNRWKERVWNLKRFNDVCNWIPSRLFHSQESSLTFHYLAEIDGRKEIET